MNHHFYWQKATTNFFITIFSCIIICGFIACNNSGKGETADKDTGEKKSQQAVAPGAANVTATFTALRFEKADVERLYGSNTWHAEPAPVATQAASRSAGNADLAARVAALEKAVEELRERAADLDIEGRSSMTKSELIDALRNH